MSTFSSRANPLCDGGQFTLSSGVHLTSKIHKDFPGCFVLMYQSHCCFMTKFPKTALLGNLSKVDKATCQKEGALI
jgi:hypothetical protein